jgi:hypothetical protein
VVCASAAAAVFCRNDAALLCLKCDAKVHGINPLAARHWRVQLCELCEREPATVYCRQVRALVGSSPAQRVGRVRARAALRRVARARTARARVPCACVATLGRRRVAVAASRLLSAAACVLTQRTCTFCGVRVWARVQDAASLCDACSKEIHEANPLAGRHVLEPVQPFASAATGLTLEGTRVAASANAAEIEEYRRQCEELLHAEEAAETTTPSALAPAAGGAPKAQDSGAGGSGVSGSAEPAHARARGGGGNGGGGALPPATLPPAAPPPAAPPALDPFDVFLGDFAELDGDEPLEFSFFESHGARGDPLLGVVRRAQPDPLPRFRACARAQAQARAAGAPLTRAPALRAQG